MEAKVEKKDSILIGTEVTKRFGNEVYVGTIDRFSSDKMLWHVTYKDGDKEEFDEEDLKKAKISNDKLILYTHAGLWDKNHMICLSQTII